MLGPRHKVFFWVGPILGVSWLSLVFLDPHPSNAFLETIGIGYLVGSLFAHATLAAAWAVLGPGPLRWRMPLSLIWVLMLGVGTAANSMLYRQGVDAEMIVLGALFFGQWLALQIPLWGLKAGFQIHLLHADQTESFDPQKWQFGIRQLMIVTAIVGVVFGIGRVLTAYLPIEFLSLGGEAPVMIFLSGCAIIFSLPLLLAALMERGAIVGIVLLLALISVATYFEEPLLRSVTRSGGRPNVYDMIAVNFFTCGLILLIAVAVRLCGCSLTRLQKTSAQDA